VASSSSHGERSGAHHDDIGDPRTSQSGENASGAMPEGSLPVAFANHEPNVMFRDSGSTIPDNESSQRRLVDQALSSRKGVGTSAARLASEDEQKSSSFPWSASEQTPSTTKTSPEGGRIDGPGVAPTDADVQDHRAAGEQMSHEQQVAPQQLSSPRVEIVAPSRNSATPKEVGSTPAPTSKKGRQRRSHTQDPEPLVSDDRPVGLPQEHYQPRPSRRRATHMVDEVIDYGVVPEKAVRAKRRKTANPAGPEAEVESGKTSKELDSTQQDPTAADANENLDTAIKPTSELPTSPPKDELPSQSPRKQAVADNIVVQPSPKPNSKRTTKSKRSHTTIFEDHVDFKGSQRTPTLSQQQAQRQSGFVSIEDEAPQRPQRPRRKVADSDDEAGDEDELALDTPEKKADDHGIAGAPEEDEVEIDEAPKKRGRGRPPKSATKAEGASAKKSAEGLHDVEDDEPSKAERMPAKKGTKASDDAEHDEPSKEDEAPVKRRRGRPPKNTSKPEIHDTTAAQHDAAPPAKESNANPSTETRDAQTTTTTAPTLQAPTPSPEKPTTSTTATSTPPKTTKASTTTSASPTSHSPLKSTSAVPLRVGLSKRQRIPSLLRMMKPPSGRKA